MVIQYHNHHAIALVWCAIEIFYELVNILYLRIFLYLKKKNRFTEYNCVIIILTSVTHAQKRWMAILDMTFFTIVQDPPPQKKNTPKNTPKTQASLAQRAIATACPQFVLYWWGTLATACECSLSLLNVHRLYFGTILNRCEK